MSSVDAKTYLSKRNVPALFECLMTGLMFHRPSDHIQYLIDCLEKVRAKGQEELRWNMFIEMQRSKTPLPPITPSNGRRPISRERSMTPKEHAEDAKSEEKVDEERPIEPRTAAPLPPIGDKGIPDVPIIFLMGGPGSGKSTQAELLLQKHPGWVTIAMGDLLRQEVAKKGAADAKWKMVSDLMSKGEMVPEDLVVTLLLTNMRASVSAKGFVIQGFPRDMEQASQYDKLVGRVDAVFLLDCEEETLSKQLLERAKDEKRIDNNVNTIAKRIQAYKEKTLPVLKHYDDMEKLFILEGEKKVQDIAEDLAIVFETVVGDKGRLSPAPPKEPKPERVRSARSGKTTPIKSRSPEPSASPATEEYDSAPLSAHLLPPEVKVKDEGRKPDMPKAPIIFFAGGPGSGKGTQCKRLLTRYTNAAHLSMGDIIRTKITMEGTADEKWDMVSELLRKGDLAPEEVTVDLLVNALQEKPDAHFYLVEGFPRNVEQLEDFNKRIGGQSFTILLDCEESILHYRLSMRGKEIERIDDNLVAIGKKLTFFKNNTLPLLKTFEDDGKLVVVNGDRDEDEIYYDLCKAIDFAIYGTLPEMPAASESKEPVKEEVIEAAVVPETATTTGDNVANPSYTAQLDALATDAQKSEDAKPAESSEGETATATTQDAAKDETSSAAAAAAEDDSKTAEAEEAKTEDTAAAPATEPSAEAAKVEEAAAKQPAEEASKPEEAAKPEEKEEATLDESPKEEASKTEEAEKSEEAPKADDGVKSDESPKGDESSPADAAATEESPKTDEGPKTEEEPETEKTDESPKTEEAPEAEEATKSEENPKTEDAPPTEGGTTAEETPKANESATAAEESTSAEAGAEPPAEETSEEKPAATTEEKKGETEETGATDAAGDATGDAEPAQ